MDKQLFISQIEAIHFDTPFGRWAISSLKPPPDLADIVEEFWEVDGFAEYAQEKRVPSGMVDILFNMGKPYHGLDHETMAVRGTSKKAWISGHHEGPLWIATIEREGINHEHLLGIRLNALGAYILLGKPAHLFTNQVIELSEVLGPGVDQFQDQLLNTPCLPTRLDLLIGFARALRAKKNFDPSAAVAWTYQQLKATAGQAQIGEMCQDFGISRKHLNALYQREVGLSPKKLARILRFSATIDFLGSRDEVHWADVAFANGYADQAHFIRDFKAFSGSTPSEYLRVRGPDGQSEIYV